MFSKANKAETYPRGFHLITEIVEDALPEIIQINIEQLQVFMKHTSASLSINKNAYFFGKNRF